MWLPPPPVAAKPAGNVNRVPQPGSLTLHCRVCNHSVEWLSGAYGAADVLWFGLRHRHDEPARKVR